MTNLKVSVGDYLKVKKGMKKQVLIHLIQDDKAKLFAIDNTYTFQVIKINYNKKKDKTIYSLLLLSNYIDKIVWVETDLSDYEKYYPEFDGDALVLFTPADYYKREYQKKHERENKNLSSIQIYNKLTSKADKYKKLIKKYVWKNKNHKTRNK